MLRPINRVHPLRIGELVTDKQMKSMDEDEESLYQVLHVPAMIPGIRDTSSQMVKVQKQYGGHGGKTEELSMPILSHIFYTQSHLLAR